MKKMDILEALDAADDELVRAADKRRPARKLSLARRVIIGVAAVLALAIVATGAVALVNADYRDSWFSRDEPDEFRDAAVEWLNGELNRELGEELYHGGFDQEQWSANAGVFICLNRVFFDGGASYYKTGIQEYDVEEIIVVKKTWLGFKIAARVPCWHEDDEPLTLNRIDMEECTIVYGRYDFTKNDFGGDIMLSDGTRAGMPIPGADETVGIPVMWYRNNQRDDACGPYFMQIIWGDHRDAEIVDLVAGGGVLVDPDNNNEIIGTVEPTYSWVERFGPLPEVRTRTEA